MLIQSQVRLVLKAFLHLLGWEEFRLSAASAGLESTQLDLVNILQACDTNSPYLTIQVEFVEELPAHE